MSSEHEAQAYVHKVAPPGSDLSYALLFAEREHRPAIGIIHALAAEIAACAEQPSAPDPGRIKLQWWVEETGRLLAGEPRHPLTRALFAAQAPDGEAQRLQAMIANAAAVLSEPAPDTPEQIVAFYRRQAAPLYASIAARHGATAPGAAALGGAVMLLEETRFLCASHTQFRSSAGDFDVATLLNAGARELHAASGQLEREELAPLRTLVVQAALMRAWLSRNRQRDVPDAPPLSPARKLWTAWRAARTTV